MRKRTIAWLLIQIPIAVFAQKQMPKFENDTLYTTAGFKMYKGMTLHIGKGTGTNGKFRFINIKSETTSKMIENDSIVIKKLKNFGISALGNAYIEIIGKKKFRDGSIGYIDLHIAFENAIQSNLYHSPGELIVPEAFITKPKTNNIASELEKLNRLFTEGALTQEEYEYAKKKLLELN